MRWNFKVFDFSVLVDDDSFDKFRSSLRNVDSESFVRLANFLWLYKTQTIMSTTAQSNFLDWFLHLVTNTIRYDIIRYDTIQYDIKRYDMTCDCYSNFLPWKLQLLLSDKYRAGRQPIEIN